MGEGDLSPRRPPQNTPPTARFQADGGIVVKVIEAARHVRRLVQWMPMRDRGSLQGASVLPCARFFRHFPRRCVPCLALIVPPRRGLDCRVVAPRLLAGWVSEETIELPSFLRGREFP